LRNRNSNKANNNNDQSRRWPSRAGRSKPFKAAKLGGKQTSKFEQQVSQPAAIVRELRAPKKYRPL